MIPPNAQVPRHDHSGEEFLHLLEGTATHIEEGSANRDLKPGEAMVIRMGKIHSPKAGPDGARAVVFRVHLEGEPERLELELARIAITPERLRRPGWRRFIQKISR